MRARLRCSDEPKYEHATQMKFKGESERKSLSGGMLQGLQKRHLRGKHAARTPRETANEQAKRRHWTGRRHWSRSLNLTPDVLRPVMTVVSRTNCAKSAA